MASAHSAKMGAGMAGLAALALVAVVAVTTLHSGPRTELSENSEAMAQAAHSARDWAAQAFGTGGGPSDGAAAIQKPVFKQGAAARRGRVADTERRQPEVHAPRFEEQAVKRSSAPELPISSDSGFFDDALSELGTAPKVSQLRQQYGEHRSSREFATAAATELPPAPKLSQLTGRKPGMFQTKGRTVQLASGHYSLTPETIGSASGEAQDFASELRREAALHKPQRQAVVAAPVAPPVKKASRFDSWGIPKGRHQGIRLHNYKPPAAKYTPARQDGISSLDADKQLMNYFTKKVQDARQAKQDGPNHHYFSTKDTARQQTLAQVQSQADAPVVAQNLHVSEYKAAEDALKGSSEQMAQVTQTSQHHKVVKKAAHKNGEDRTTNRELQARLDRAYKKIKELARHEEKRLKLKSRHAALALEERLGGYSKRGSAPADLDPVKDMKGQGLHDALQDVRAARAVKESGSAKQALESDVDTESQVVQKPKKYIGLTRGMSASEARKDLMDSMNSNFASTMDQDRADQQRLRSMDDNTAQADVMNYLDSQASRTREQDLQDERHLKVPSSQSPEARLRAKEEGESMAVEATYENALRDALGKSPVLPSRHIPTRF